MKKRKRTQTTPQVLRYLAMNEPSSKWQIAKALRKSYSNIHATIQLLKKAGYIEIVKCKPSEKNPKIKVEYYGLTLAGLIVYLMNNKDALKQIDEIAEVHDDKLLVFKKWQLFKAAGLREKMLSYIEDAIKAELMFIIVGRSLGLKVKTKREKLQEGFDMAVLYTPLFGEKEEARSLIKIYKQDEELSSFIDKCFQMDFKEYERTLQVKKLWESMR